MARIVMKFGGTSVADLDHIAHAACHVAREVNAGHDVAVIVSAMYGKTNELVGWCQDIDIDFDQKEYDAVVASGEQVTAGLMALTLQKMGIDARSWLGWQLPIRTTDVHSVARITDITTQGLEEDFDDKKVSVIAGFQGVSPQNRITSLGRGGSDTSAVAVAAALKAHRCDIYTDVDGVYTTDPRIVPRAQRLCKVSFEEMLEMASLGAKVLQTRSVELAMVYGVRLCVRSSFEDPALCEGKNAPAIGTLVCDEDEIVEKQVVSGVTYSRGEAKITLRGVKDEPGIAAKIFKTLAQAQITVDMIVQNVSEDGQTTDITFTIPDAEYDKALQVIKELQPDLVVQNVKGEQGGAKISVVGIGMRSYAGAAAKMFDVLAEKNINIQLITTSEIKVSVLIDEAYTELAVRTLHSSFDLDAD